MTGRPPPVRGNIPEGIWVLNQARSQRLIPGTHTLWIIRDDGKRLIFASVETDPQKQVKLTSWDGEYGGPPVVVVGSGMLAQLTSSRPGQMRISGEIPDMGSFVEDCVVEDGGRRLRCVGKIEGPTGTLSYRDDFDWFSPGPGMQGD